MIRDICTDERLLAQPSGPATVLDLPTAADQLDTLSFHRQRSRI